MCGIASCYCRVSSFSVGFPTIPPRSLNKWNEMHMRVQRTYVIKHQSSLGGEFVDFVDEDEENNENEVRC